MSLGRAPDDAGILELPEALDQEGAGHERHAPVEIGEAPRRWRLLGWVVDFARLNRRMHNKSFTADGQATIIGGRNVGDEYFGVGRHFDFIDLDVLAIGPVVADVASDFERYWTSASSVPAPRVLRAATAYLAALRRCPLVQDLMTGSLRFE